MTTTARKPVPIPGLEQHEPAPGGYLIASGDGPRVARTIGQQTMQSALLPRIYARWWRPLLFTAFALGDRTVIDPRTLVSLLGLRDGTQMLDVACGPGIVVRAALDAIGDDGQVVGVDAAPGMLAQAVAATADPRATFVLADAGALPFPDAGFDAVSCSAGLHLIGDPEAALAEMARVLRPGGRLALLVPAVRGPRAVHGLQAALPALTGVRLLDPAAVTGLLRGQGLQAGPARLRGAWALIAATKPVRR